MNTASRRGEIQIRSVRWAYNLPMARWQVPPPPRVEWGDTCVRGPVYGAHTVAPVASRWLFPRPALRRDRGSAAHPPYFGLYSFQQLQSADKAKGTRQAHMHSHNPRACEPRRFLPHSLIRGTPFPFWTLQNLTLHFAERRLTHSEKFDPFMTPNSARRHRHQAPPDWCAGYSLDCHSQSDNISLQILAHHETRKFQFWVHMKFNWLPFETSLSSDCLRVVKP